MYIIIIIIIILLLLYQLPNDTMTAVYFNRESSSVLCITLRCTDCHVAYIFWMQSMFDVLLPAMIPTL